MSWPLRRNRRIGDLAFKTRRLVLVAAGLGCGHQAEPPTSAEGYLAGAGGARIFYQVAGSGSDTVVVVHGGPGAGINDIRPDLEPLTNGHVVIFYDQRGGGRSELPKDTTLLAPRHFVGDLEGVRGHFQLQRMNLVAQSFGAIVAAEYARVHPGRVAKMVFLNATGPDRKEAARFYGSSPAPSDTASARLRSEVLKSLFEGNAADPVAACRQYEALDRRLAVAAGEFVKKGTTCEMPAAAVRYYYRYTAILGPEAFGKWDFTHSLSELQAPLLVIDGEGDKRGLAMERAWARAVPNGRLLIIPDAGRVAHAERPQVVFPAIDEFLRGTWPKGALP